jgi:hypothetical protein
LKDYLKDTFPSYIFFEELFEEFFDEFFEGYIT